MTTHVSPFLIDGNRYQSARFMIRGKEKRRESFDDDAHSG